MMDQVNREGDSRFSAFLKMKLLLLNYSVAGRRTGVPESTS